MKFTLKQFLIYLLSALLGCFFIFSAYTKTEPIQFFEYTLYAQLHLSQNTAAYFARFFIGLEAGLGLLLLLNIYGRGKWVIKMAFWLIVAFSIHLAILYFNAGNDVNCGCMGSMIPMTPVVSIIKNIALLCLLALLLKKSTSESSNTLHWLASIVLAIVVAVPFALFPSQSKTVALSKLYNPANKEIPQIELRKGKHFVGFLSLSCSHCREAAKDLRKMKAADTSLPIYFVFMDPENDTVKTDMLQDFMMDTKANNIPYNFLAQDPFREIAGMYVPAMFWLQDTTIIRKLNVPDLNQKEFQLWLKSN
ncbi:hypothetical protein DBR32_13225 [Taibaiella sp. KBW10]|uniref:MauE/DoxX family redox-associated membrane protein n=1 Tax=Taibaiella sp. KBW10 TaxID=2153357 RepID=UPI000F59E854|nr:MauE/DoxX family redox-associated membrane protein [Taibaiella sp. KBW10]RQO30520.1 hypothetical protein DBR32_13225 [Taibaiella sp. KBW10]